MSKRSVFTTVSPLPPGISREQAVAFLQNHQEMIDLNPLVIERHPIAAPPHAEPDELECSWYSIRDRISYLPGDLATGNITYSAAFHDLPHGIQTHCYAPLGVHIRSRWTVAGSLPGEPVEPVELGLQDAPRTGLYLREDVDLRANILMSAFVKKTIKSSHSLLVTRLKDRARLEVFKPAPAGPAPAPVPAPAHARAPADLPSHPPPPYLNATPGAAPYPYLPQNPLPTWDDKPAPGAPSELDGWGERPPTELP